VSSQVQGTLLRDAFSEIARLVAGQAKTRVGIVRVNGTDTNLSGVVHAVYYNTGVTPPITELSFGGVIDITDVPTNITYIRFNVQDSGGRSIYNVAINIDPNTPITITQPGTYSIFVVAKVAPQTSVPVTT